ncbi:YihY/virulence factor BrkB family protein [Acidiferrimicrobium sp. IK]|uniref:YihY/virulence factor BrkB family protein n=1 Tax=Acidiferrimicrobium sp. IK TaxID=2871700 RepID=UPI0021CB711E|nr:YihY/virulence factor BrkB family protein [Acidiferrimicrobium sp. IK]MCU4184297.1 YihY/virulence factor BrkB family protein [Acidiferrimicrobium sp. IK]
MARKAMSEAGRQSEADEGDGTGVARPWAPTAGSPTGAPGPGRLSRRFAWRVVALIWHKTFEDRILGLAAEAGFWALVSLPSMLLAIFGALGYLRGVIGATTVSRVHQDVLRAAGDVLTPATVSSDVAPILNEVLARGHLEVVSIGFVISLWSGSTAMSDYVNTITVAYGMRGLRGAVRSRLVALWLYLCALVAGIVLLPALALGPDLITQMFPGNVHDEVRLTVQIMYWPVIAVGSVAVLSMLYKACLPVRVAWRRGLPGATVAMVLWVFFSFAVRAYLTSSFRQRSAYGSLSAPIAGLLFFYFTALAVLLGAEINSAIDALHPVRSTEDGRARSRLKAAGGASPYLAPPEAASGPAASPAGPLGPPPSAGREPATAPDRRRRRDAFRRLRWSPRREPVPVADPHERR